MKRKVLIIIAWCGLFYHVDCFGIVPQGKKLTGPLIAVLDAAVQFRPEILDKMQKATGRADAVFKMLGGEDINGNLSSDDIKNYLEGKTVKGEFNGEFKGMGQPLVSYFYNKKKKNPNMPQYIRQCFSDGLIRKDPSLAHADVPEYVQHSVLLKFFEKPEQKDISSKDFQHNFLDFLKQEIQTTEQLKAFVEEVRLFFNQALSEEEKKAYLAGILMFVAQFFDEMSKNSSKVVLLIRESLFGDQKSEAHDQQAYLLKYFKAASGGLKQTLLAYLDQDIHNADQLKAVCGEIKTFFADVYTSMTKAATDAFKKYQVAQDEKYEQLRLEQLKQPKATVPTHKS